MVLRLTGFLGSEARYQDEIDVLVVLLCGLQLGIKPTCTISSLSLFSLNE
jgi:hypothetical protein